MVARKGGKCTCNPLSLIAALVLFAVGLYAVASGYLNQQAGVVYWQVISWYLGGFVLFAIGKILKHSGSVCSMHSK